MAGSPLPIGNDGAPAGEDQVAAVRAVVPQLVALDVESGGDRTSVLASRALRTAETMLAPGACEPRVERDLRAAVAELAELTGWLLCDASRHAASLARNHQALRLARSVGDRSMELFVIHNLSLQATYLRRPERSLALVRPILDQGGLTPRLGAMFQMRLARAYAQIEAGAWRDGAATAERLVPLLGQVRSTRPLARLMATIGGARRSARSAVLDDVVAAIEHALENRSP